MIINPSTITNVYTSNSGQISDSGKYMVKATNAAGEAKSIADCAVLEPTPERMQEVVKTVVYERPDAFTTEVSLKLKRHKAYRYKWNENQTKWNENESSSTVII